MSVRQQPRRQHVGSGQDSPGPTAPRAATVTSTEATTRMLGGEDLRRESFSGTGPGTPGETPAGEPRTVSRPVLPQIRQGRKGADFSTELDSPRTAYTHDSDRDEQ
jgi:hypothetical protein